jgi:hypothetical protein
MRLTPVLDSWKTSRKSAVYGKREIVLGIKLLRNFLPIEKISNFE